MTFFKRLLARLRGERRGAVDHVRRGGAASPANQLIGSAQPEAVRRMAREVQIPDERELEVDRWLGQRSSPSTGEVAAAPAPPRSETEPGTDTPEPAVDVEGPTHVDEPSSVSGPPVEAAGDPEPAPTATPPAAPQQVHLLDVGALADMPVDPLRFAPPRGRATRRQASSPLPPHVVEEMVERFEEGAARVASVLAREPATIELPERSQSLGYSRPEFPRRTNRVKSGVTPLREILAQGPGGSGGVDALDRLECARLVARIVHALHAGDVVTTGLSTESFGLQDAERPHVVLLETCLLRPLGGEALDGSIPFRGLDEDRVELAEVIGELLGITAVSDRAEGGGSGAVDIPGLLPDQAHQVKTWWSNAVHQGLAPRASRWLEVLES